MSENAIEYRLGPRPMDVAAKLPGGWTRLANARRLTEADVADWKLLSCWADQAPDTTLVNTDHHEQVTEELRALRVENGTLLEDRDAARGWVNQVLDVVGEPPGGDYDQLGEHVKKVLTDARAEKGDPQRHKLSPSEIKLKMLLAFEAQVRESSQGISMREAAERAGVLSLSNYTSRFGSDLVAQNWVKARGKVGHSWEYVITQVGHDELARQRGQA